MKLEQRKPSKNVQYVIDGCALLHPFEEQLFLLMLYISPKR